MSDTRDALRAEHPPRSADALSEPLVLIESVVVLAATYLAVVALLGVSTAMLAMFSGLVVAATAAFVVLGGVAVSVRRHGFPRLSRPDVPSMFVVSFVVLVTAWNVGRVGHPVLIQRDPGSYLNTARWLARDGGLRLRLEDGILRGVEGIRFEGPAVYQMGERTLEFQFSHGVSVVMATAFELVGSRGIVFANLGIGAIALLALYSVLRRLGINAVIASAATVALALSVPFLYVTRSTYSEPLTMLLVWTGILLFIRAAPQAFAGRHALLASFLIGGVVLMRVDGVLYLIALCAALSVVAIGRDHRRLVVCSLLAASVPVIVGVIDLYGYTGRYASDLSSSVFPLFALTALSLLVVIGASLLGSRRPMTVTSSQGLALSVAAATSMIVLAAWIVRPRVHTAQSRAHGGQSPNESLVAGLQQREGVAIDSSQTYVELSVTQIGWYFGAPMLILAALGFGVIVFRGLRHTDKIWAAMAAFLAVATPLYIWRPSIFPDHPWMTRRFTPFVYPAFLMSAAVASTWLINSVERFGRPWRHVLAWVLSVCLVAPVVATTWPIRELSDNRGAIIALDEACDVVPEGSTVVTVGFPAITQAFRSWCGAEAGDADLVAVRQVIEQARALCVETFAVGPGSGSLSDLSDAFQQITIVDSPSVGSAVLTLTIPPSELSHGRLVLEIGRINLPAECS